MTDDTQNPGGWPGAPGVPENPEQSAEHWVRNKMWRRNPAAAPFTVWRWSLGGWNNGLAVLPAEMIAGTYDYFGPCLTPAEVAARVAEARAEGMREAAGIAVAVRQQANECAREPGLIDNIRREYLAQARGAEDVQEAILNAVAGSKS